MVARTYTKVARAAGEDRTRAALLDAAEAAFYEGPWDRVSLQTVAVRAGVTKQTLLRHFGSKEGLLEQASRRSFEQVRAQRLAAPTGDLDADVDNLLDHYEEYGERALKLSAMDGNGPIVELGRRARALHYDWVDHAFGPWLRAKDGRRREHLRGALIALFDVQTWNILARDLGLARRDVRATLVLAIARLLGETA